MRKERLSGVLLTTSSFKCADKSAKIRIVASYLYKVGKDSPFLLWGGHLGDMMLVSTFFLELSA